MHRYVCVSLANLESTVNSLLKDTSLSQTTYVGPCTSLSVILLYLNYQYDRHVSKRASCTGFSGVHL